MIDINYHVVTETGHPPPSDFFVSFTQLGELNVLDYAFARRIAGAAGLRNRLVHEYDAIDARRVLEVLERALHDIPEYLRAVRSFVDSRADGT